MFNRLRGRSSARRYFTLASLLLFPAALCAQQVVHVPAEQPTLQQAMAAVPDGGIIELAGGTYNAPPNGFSIDTSSQALAKAFTIRAAAGAPVVLSGGGSHDIIRFANPPTDKDRAITFQGLTFANGVSTTNFLGGAITLANANAIFVSCVFQDNAANGPITGGGALWLAYATASFQDCVFSDNTSLHYGAGLSAYLSRVFIRGCNFTSNRTNVPNHVPNAQGGAIANASSEIRIDNSRFENNHAGYVGGAIFCGGEWSEPFDVPAAQLIVTNSLFIGNSAAPHGSVTPPTPTFAGAIHLEDQTTGRFFNCRFVGNSADHGGAISSYRAISEFEGCVFDGNFATGDFGGAGSGGAIIGISGDVPDSSTNNGTINRRSIVLKVRDSLFRGVGGGNRDALHGGGIFVSGDTNAAYGLNGITQNGTEASNRATVELSRVSFFDLNASNTAAGISAGFVALTMDKSIIENCRTTNDGAGLRLIEASTANVTNSTISRCRAGTIGGGVLMFGGTLNISNTHFVENQITGSGLGSALLAGPATDGNGVPGRPITGMIQQCVFSNNSGAPTIYDGDRFDPPFNLLQYSGNTIFSANGSVAYQGDGVNASTVAQLNQLVLHRSDGTITVKAPAPANVAPASAPAIGALLMIPPTVLQSGAPGESLPVPSYLSYSASGGAVALDGAPRSSSAGIVPTTVNGVHTLTVGSTSVSTVPPPGAALNISTRLPVGTDQSVLIGGFIIQGPNPKNVVIRAIGPSLPLAGALQNPFLELHDGTGALIATNDNWRSTQIGGILTSHQMIDIQASGVAPSNDAESAIVATLSPGAYTAVVRGAGNTTGIAVVEGYDLDADQSSKLANISTRGFIQTGDNVMIGGFIMGGGTGATRVVVRGIGPSLGAFGITNPLADPMIELHDANGTLIDSNDNWRTIQALIQPTGLAPSNDAESALLLTNPAPGAYTAILRGTSNGTGVGVVEVYVFQ
jgi:hypothetical protein